MLGFPIRTSSDHSSVDSSPRLIAASYVLHRLLVPRHPPCALKNLATKMLASTVQFSNNNRNQPHTPRQHRTQAGSSSDSKCRPGERNKQQRSEPHGPLPYARPLRTQQRTYSSPPTTSPFQLTPTKEWTTALRRSTDHVVLDTDDNDRNRTSQCSTRELHRRTFADEMGLNPP